MQSVNCEALRTYCLLWLVPFFLTAASPSQAQVQAAAVIVNNEDFCADLGFARGGREHLQCVANLDKTAKGAKVQQAATTISDEDYCAGMGMPIGSAANRNCVSGVNGRPPSNSAPAAAYASSGQSQTAKSVPRTVASIAPATTPHEQTCIGYGFRRGTKDYSYCLMQLDQAQQQAEFEQRRYELQMAQYQQQQAAYEAQQAAIKKERDRRKWAVLAAFGFGMASTNSPTFSGGMADGFRALNGQAPLPAPVAPVPPGPRNYTVRLPNGNQVYCHYSGSYMSCR